jgi:exodeoxyribonuclease III
MSPANLALEISGAAVRIATYNINGVNGRLSNLLAWLDEARPDVVCLQELKASDEKFPEAAIRSAGYEAIWHGQRSWNGVAILGRGVELVETRRGLPGDPTTRTAATSKRRSAA